MKNASPRRHQRQSRAPGGARAALLATIVFGVLIAAGAMIYSLSRAKKPTAAGTQSAPRRDLAFNKDIAPIIFNNCSTCHRPGQPAPFSLLSFADVKKHASDIADVTARRYMPPWLPAHGFGEFVGERRLTDEQIAAVQQWVAAGAPEGNAADRPSPPQFSNGWQFGTPDAIARMPEPYVMPAGGRDVYRNFVVPLPMTERRYIRAIEFKADTRVLHHVFLYFDRSRQSRRVDAQDAEIGFGGMRLPATAESPSGYFLSWQPGRGPTISPPGLAWAIEANSDLVLQAHMQPGGKPEPVQPSIGLYFTSEPPTNTPFKIGLDSYQIDIPAGTTNYVVEDSYTVPVAVDVLAVLPHAHYLARKVEGEAILPDGHRQWLLKIDDWDFNWQSDFRYTHPVPLPRGTRLAMRWTFDNSTNNLRNPNRPPRRVRYGLQSSDEMAELYFQVLPRTSADLATLDTDYQWHALKDIVAFNTMMIEQDRSNAHAHVQLGKALMAFGKRAEALGHLRRALALDPNEEEGHYNLGAILMDTEAAAAEAEFKETLRVNPENYKARNNLGLLYMRSGRLDEAEAQFNAGLQANPGDAYLKQNLELLGKARQGK